MMPGVGVGKLEAGSLQVGEPCNRGAFFDYHWPGTDLEDAAGHCPILATLGQLLQGCGLAS